MPANSSIHQPVRRNTTRTNLYILLSAIFLTNALIAEIIGVKIFSVETLLGVKPAQDSPFRRFCA